MLALMGKKCGMSRQFLEDGTSIPVTILEVLPNCVTQIKTIESDGYNAIQVGSGNAKANKINKPLKGHLAKAKVGAVNRICEFRANQNHEVNSKKLDEITLGAEFTVNVFTVGEKVDVTGTSKGKGFTGVVKRYGFACQDATHGNSLSHRAPGSIGQNQTPGRVFKGKKMAGQSGNKNRTTQNLEIIGIDENRNLILVKGAVPGSINGQVVIKIAVKHSGGSR